jgi:hypothetical protein
MFEWVLWLNSVNTWLFFEEKLVSFKKCCTFVSVFHGIRFKVRRLFVVMTSNFFLHHSQFIDYVQILTTSPTDQERSRGLFFAPVPGN